MKGLLAIFEREVRIRGRLLVAAAVAAILAYAIPLLRGIPALDAQEVRAWIGAAFAVVLGLGAAFGLGATMLPGAIASGRIRFDLSRPCSTLEIWLGRTLAGIAVCALVAAIALLPIWIGGAGIALEGVLPSGWPVLVLVLLAATYLIAQASGIAARSKSPLILLDCIAATFVALAIFTSVRRLNDLDADGPRRIVLAATVILLFAALAAATFVATTRGRSDLRTAHLAQSAVLWPVLAFAAAAALGTAWWVSRATPFDFTAIHRVTPAPRGAWLRVNGIARGGDATFLYDTASRRFVRIGAASVLFSDSGEQAVWLERDGRSPAADLRRCRLGDGRVAETPLRFSRHDEILAISDDGGRVAVQSGHLAAVHALGDGRLLASTPVGNVLYALFEESGALRLYARSGELRVQILRFDPATRRLEDVGAIETATRWEGFRINKSRSRLLIREMVSGAIQLFDAQSGRHIRMLADRSDYFSSALFLADGRIVIRSGSRADSRFRVFNAEGDLIREIPGEPSRMPALGGEILPGKVVLAHLWEATGPGSSLLDVDAGSIRQFARELVPVVGDPFWSWGWRSDPSSPATGSMATRLFFEGEWPRERLFLVDPVSGARTRVLGPEK